MHYIELTSVPSLDQPGILHLHICTMITMNFQKLCMTSVLSCKIRNYKRVSGMIEKSSSSLFNQLLSHFV